MSLHAAMLSYDALYLDATISLHACSEIRRCLSSFSCACLYLIHKQSVYEFLGLLFALAVYRGGGSTVVNILYVIILKLILFLFFFASNLGSSNLPFHFVVRFSVFRSSTNSCDMLVFVIASARL